MKTHSLALLMTQRMTNNGSSNGETKTFTRLQNTDIKDTAIPDTAIHHYTGPKKLKIAPEEVKPGVLPTEIIEKQVAIKK